MGLELSRVAEIAVQNPNGGWELASGYLLDGAFVLTARHVLTFRQPGTPPQRTALVCLPRLAHSYRSATLYWAGDVDDDFAILKLDDSLVDYPMVRWGDLVRPPEAGIAWHCTIVGFPYSASQLDPADPRVIQREAQQFAPDLLPAGGFVHDLLQIDTVGGLTDTWLAQLSGAPVFVGDLLVGVVHAHHQASTGIWALPVRRLFRTAGTLPPLVGVRMEEVRVDQPPIQGFLAHERALIDHRANRIRRLLAAFGDGVDEVAVKLIQNLIDHLARFRTGLVLGKHVGRVFVLADVLEFHLNAQLVQRAFDEH